MAYPKTIAFILAGGKGERLFPLTAFRSKPAVPFGGRYRIIDFVLSNLINSQIFSVYLLVQYKSQSLIEHIRQNWVLSSIIRDHFVAVVPPQMRMGPDWFQGTADAVFQNINLIRDHNPGLVVIFGADHIYRMDIRQMIEFHLSRDASVTVAARSVPIEHASSFGVIVADREKRITGFQEKPKNPAPMPEYPDRAYVSMGNYIFKSDVLTESLIKAQRKNQYDFGAHVIPDLVESGSPVFAYDFDSNVVPGIRHCEEKGYWRDVGNIRSFFDAHMDMLGPSPKFEANNPHWPILSSSSKGASTNIVNAAITNSLMADGTTVYGSEIKNSVIRSGVVIEEGVSVKDCIIMEGVYLKRGCSIQNAIVDKHNIIGEGQSIGFDAERDRFMCHIDSSGIAIVPRKGTPAK
ncbi:MAG: glucose-1-phosphate adenylyltransferase [Nitrospirae bacterium]|nr:glucose-1-phosphate adenylyltransferase [Nitrospirota bacterium]